MKTLFLTGGTGYIGTRLIKILLQRGHRVIALVRPGSESKVPPGAEILTGNPFDASSFVAHIPAGSTFVQLLGVPHPSPRKRAQFYQIDLPSVQQSAYAAKQAGVAHFVYLSVSQTPTRIMHDYQQVRASGEQALRATGLPRTFLRPWYVVGPGHWWPVLLWPVYWLLSLTPLREKARDLGLVTLSQMLRALLFAVEHPPVGEQVLNVPEIKSRLR